MPELGQPGVERLERPPVSPPLLWSAGEHVAIKFLQLGPRFHERFVAREILNHRRLFHPHIVAFKEVFVVPQVRALCVVWRHVATLVHFQSVLPSPLSLSQYLAIVMEYVGGGNLQQYVERAGHLPEWLARCFFQQLILALQYLHETVNIAHRDIKLGNILLNTKYKIPILKLCDFGYSKVGRDGERVLDRRGGGA